MRTKILNLKNGAKLLLTRRKNIEGVRAELIFNAGAINDPKGKRGLAHFCEHAIMNFSTSKLSSQEKNENYNKYKYFNASTSNYKVNFIVEATRDKIKNALDLLCHSFKEIKYSKENFENEYNVIKNEIMTRIQRNNIENFINFQSQILKSKYHKNFISRTAGTIETLNNITLKDIEFFIKNYFTLNNLTISITGNLTKKEAKQIAKDIVYKYIETSNIDGIKKGIIEKVAQPKYFYVPAVENGKALINLTYLIKTYNEKNIKLSESLKMKVFSEIINKKCFIFFRTKKTLCYNCQSFVDIVENYVFLNIIINCTEENVDNVIKNLKTFIYEELKTIDYNSFNYIINNELNQMNFDILNINQINYLANYLYEKHNIMFSSNYHKTYKKLIQNIKHENIIELNDNIKKIKPYLTIVSNNLDYKNFDYKNFIKNLNNKEN